ncbi:MAG: hypothetical protein SOW68_00790, partial [Eubacteriales bacterium]|nr:hypothetical protein [Eubacteriales bacterium]
GTYFLACVLSAGACLFIFSPPLMGLFVSKNPKLRILLRERKKHTLFPSKRESSFPSRFRAVF